MSRRPIARELTDWIAIVIDDNADDLLSYLRRRVSDPQDAADLFGHVLLALWEQGERIPTADTDARMWCFGIARNVLREHYRNTAKRLSLADRLRDRLLSGSLQTGGADTAAEENMRATRVRRAVASLDDRSRELVILVHWDGFTVAQAARHLFLNDSSARTRLSRALRRLEQQLSEEAAPTDATPPATDLASLQK